MMTEPQTRLFETLAEYDIGADTLEKIVNSLTKDKFLALVNQLSEQLPRVPPDSTTMFDFIANKQLSGEPDHCSDIACRLTRADELGRFAALYAERVLIRDPFPPYRAHKKISADLKEVFIGDIKILLHWKPVIEAGIIQFAEPMPHFCADCIRQNRLGDEEELSRMVMAEEIMVNQYAEHMTATLKYEQDEHSPFCLKIKAPSHIIEHGQRITYYKSLPAHLSFLKKLATDGKSRKINKKDLILLAHILINPAFNDVYMHNLHARLTGCQYLTDRQTDLELISLIEDPGQKKQSQALMEGFSHNLPQIENIDLGSLIALRAREYESFRVYRDALEAALKTIDKKSPKKVKELFRDTVEPELNKLNLSMRNSSRLLKSIAGREVAVSVGIMIVGLFAGILPENLSNIVAALGGMNALKSIAGKTLDSFHEPKDIKDNKYYFLWKASQLRKQ